MTSRTVLVLDIVSNLSIHRIAIDRLVLDIVSNLSIYRVAMDLKCWISCRIVRYIELRYIV